MGLKVTQSPVDVLLLEQATAEARASGASVDVMVLTAGDAAARASGAYIDVLVLEGDGTEPPEPPETLEHPLAAQHVVGSSSFVLNLSTHVIKA